MIYNKFLHHDENCSCGCHDEHEHEEQEYDVVNVTLEDGSEIECAVIDFVTLKEQDYIFLLPLTENEDDSLLVYRYFEDGDDSFSLERIESDEEFEMVSSYFEGDK